MRREVKHWGRCDTHTHTQTHKQTHKEQRLERIGWAWESRVRVDGEWDRERMGT